VDACIGSDKPPTNQPYCLCVCNSGVCVTPERMATICPFFSCCPAQVYCRCRFQPDWGHFLLSTNSSSSNEGASIQGSSSFRRYMAWIGWSWSPEHSRITGVSAAGKPPTRNQGPRRSLSKKSLRPVMSNVCWILRHLQFRKREKRLYCHSFYHSKIRNI
jgi:hypothetical protein